MRNWPRTLGVSAALLALVGVAGWVTQPDLRERVRLMSPEAMPWITAGRPVSGMGLAETTPSSAAPCTQTDLDAWQMPTPPDATSRHVTLYSDRVGTKRVLQGEMLVPGVMVASVTATQITLTCSGRGSSHLSRQLNATQQVSSGQSARPLAPLGN